MVLFHKKLMKAIYISLSDRRQATAFGSFVSYS